MQRLINEVPLLHGAQMSRYPLQVGWYQYFWQETGEQPVEVQPQTHVLSGENDWGIGVAT